MDTAIVYMVAGLSSRFDGKIKQFARVGPNNETLIEYSLNQALSAGFTKIVFIVGEKTEKPFKEMFGDKYQETPIEYAFQEFNKKERNKPWGTLDALCSAKDLLDCPFVVCNGDDIYGKNTFKTLVNHLENNSTSATVGYRLGNVLPEQGSVNRGIFQVNLNNLVKHLKEEFEIERKNLESKNLNENDLCSMNIFALWPKDLELLNSKLNEFKKEHEGDKKIETLIPEEISKLIEENKTTVQIYQATDQWYGVTNPDDEKIVREQLKNN